MEIQVFCLKIECFIIQGSTGKAIMIMFAFSPTEMQKIIKDCLYYVYFRDKYSCLLELYVLLDVIRIE